MLQPSFFGAEFLRNYPGNCCRYRCRCRNRFGGTYATYETDRTNESAPKIARDGAAGLGLSRNFPGTRRRCPRRIGLKGVSV
jgi:hypothetical protein